MKKKRFTEEQIAYALARWSTGQTSARTRAVPQISAIALSLTAVTQGVAAHRGSAQRVHEAPTRARMSNARTSHPIEYAESSSRYAGFPWRGSSVVPSVEGCCDRSGIASCEASHLDAGGRRIPPARTSAS